MTRIIQTIEDYRKLCHKYFPAQSENIIKKNWESIQYLPKGTIIRMPYIEGCLIGSFEVF